jgi:hypothetical protein
MRRRYFNRANTPPSEGEVKQAGRVVASARHSQAAPFEAQVVVDDALVMGQNPASAARVPKAMIGLLEQRQVIDVAPVSGHAETTTAPRIARGRG